MPHLIGLVLLGVSVVLFLLASIPEPPNARLHPLGLAFMSGGLLALQV